MAQGWDTFLFALTKTYIKILALAFTDGEQDCVNKYTSIRQVHDS